MWPAENSQNPARDILLADLELIREVSSAVVKGEFTPYENLLAPFVILAFVAKTGLYDIPKATLKIVQQALEKVQEAFETNDNSIQDPGNATVDAHYRTDGNRSRPAKYPGGHVPQPRQSGGRGRNRQ
jgi:hypothetical protein